MCFCNSIITDVGNLFFGELYFTACHKKYESECVLTNVQSYGNGEFAAYFDGGNITITGAESKFVSSSDHGYCIYYEKEGTFTIEDGLIEGGKNAIGIYGENTVLIVSGGKIKAGENCNACTYSQIRISGGEITGNITGSDVSASNCIINGDVSSEKLVLGKDVSITGNITGSDVSASNCIINGDVSSEKLVLGKDVSITGYIAGSDVTASNCIINGGVSSKKLVLGKDFSITGSIDLFYKPDSCIYLSDDLTNPVTLNLYEYKDGQTILKNIDDSFDYVSTNYSKFSFSGNRAYAINSSGTLILSE